MSLLADDPGGALGPARTAGAPFRLDEAIADVYADLRLTRVLHRLLRHTRRLTGSPAGSVSVVDARHGRYLKAAEYGAACQVGRTFPLHEGATGRAFHRRAPVIIPEYAQLPAGHLAPTEPARRGPAVAVPIWWRGEVIAVHVAFGAAAGRFSSRDLDDLEVLTQSAAAAIVASGRQEPSIAALIRGDLAYPTTGATRAAPLLTARQAEVLGLLRRGLTDRAIADRLVLSRKTVEKHVSAILRRTGAANRTAAVAAALDNAWLDGERRTGNLPHSAGPAGGS